jgi:hypothetical protein
VHYRLNERIGVFGRVGYRNQDGGNFGRSYDGTSVGVGVHVAW